MNTIRRYWIYESLLITIAIGAFAFAAFRIVGARENDAVAPETAIVQVGQDVFEELVVDSEDESAESDSENDPIASEFDDEYAEEESDGEFYLEDAAAKFMQLEVEQVESAIKSGLSLAEIATRAGVDVQAFTNAMVAQEQASIEQLMQSGEISAEEAAEWHEEVQQWTPFFINTVYLYPEMVAAELIGISEDALYEQLESGNGQTVAAVAEANGVAAQAVIDAVIASEMKLVDEMVVAGLIDADEGEEWKLEAADEMTRLVMDPFEEAAE